MGADELNIVFFSGIQIFPINCEGASRVFHLAKTISDMGENVYLITNSKNGGAKRIDNLNMLGCPFVKGKLPILSRNLSRLNLVREFNRIGGKIDIIQCESPAVFVNACLASLYHNAHIVLDELGVEIDLIRDVYFSKPNMIKKASVLFTEFASVKLSSHIFACSQVDAERISRIYKVKGDKITEIPNAVNSGFFEEIEPYRFEKPTMLFLGTFKHPQNCYAAKIAKEIILPRVLKEEKSVQFAFVGQEPPAWLENTEGIKVLGFVPDVRPFIKGADICIAPILHGSGTRLKILEYMALGKPVISTSKGVEGIGVVNNENIIIEDDVERFSSHIVSLLHDTVRADKLGEKAIRLIQEKYTWEKVCAKAIEVYRKL